MLKKLGFLKNPLVDLEYYEKLRTTNRKFPIPIKHKLTQNIQTSKDEMSQNSNNNNSQTKFSNMNNKNRYNKYSFNNYQYMKQKALIFINKTNNKNDINNNINNNANTTIKKLTELNQKISPIKKKDKHVFFSPSLCPNGNNNIKNRNKERKRNLSVYCEKRRNMIIIKQ